MTSNISNVSYISDFESKYQKGMEMTFKTDGNTEHSCEFNKKMGSVAILLFHRNLDKFMLVKQFRPAVFTSLVASLPENEGKELNEIAWSSYPASIGETLELCAGLIDKDGLTPSQIAAEEVAEECGYRVDADALIHVATVVVGAHQSGNAQYVYYAEVDDTQKISEGGGNVDEGEAIQKVFVTVDEARAIGRPREESPADLKGPPGVMLAFQWWFLILDPHRKGLIAHPPTGYHWSPTSPKTISDVKFDANFDKKKYNYNPKRMQFTLDGMTRLWDLALYPDSATCILVDMHKKELILMETFRPPVFIGRTRTMSENAGKRLDEIDYSKSDPKWAYSLELPSLRVPRHSSPRKFARIAVKQAGYDVPETSLHYVAKCVPGIGQSGDAQFMFVADAAAARRCEPEHAEPEHVRELRVAFSDLAALYNQRLVGSPNTYFAIGYVLDELLEKSTL